LSVVLFVGHIYLYQKIDIIIDIMLHHHLPVLLYLSLQPEQLQWLYPPPTLIVYRVTLQFEEQRVHLMEMGDPDFIVR